MSDVLQFPEPIHRLQRIGLSQWIARLCAQAKEGFYVWQLEEAGRRDFDLREDSLDRFTHRCVASLLSAGASPTRWDAEQSGLSPLYCNDENAVRLLSTRRGAGKRLARADDIWLVEVD